MKRDPECKWRLAEFKEATQRVIDRLNPKTLGPCHYCGWPVSQACVTTPDGFVRVCALCLKFTDTIFTRRWEDEEPSCAI